MNPNLFISFILNLIPGEFEALSYNVHQSGQAGNTQGNTGVIYVGQKDPGRGLRSFSDALASPVLSAPLNLRPCPRFHP